MKVLVIGSGGREHALCWKLTQSPLVEKVYAIPGSDGMRDVASAVPVASQEDILDFARLMQVDLTVAGPETVLAEGLADKFRDAGLAFFRTVPGGGPHRRLQGLREGTDEKVSHPNGGISDVHR